jgi:hypothetical protein
MTFQCSQARVRESLSSVPHKKAKKQEKKAKSETVSSSTVNTQTTKKFNRIFTKKKKKKWITKIFNSIFEQHEHLDAIGKCLLLPLNKPGKPKTVDNTRAITLLNIVRKTLSIAVLQRIYPDIDKYLSPSQSGFRRNRSTADVV